MNEPLVLGIETSCDETGVGIVRGHTLLADALASSVEQHARFGGVVPEVASRAHLEAIVPTMRRAFLLAVLMALGVGVLATVIAAPMAWLAARTDLPGRGVVRMLVCPKGQRLGSGWPPQRRCPWVVRP